ncbi:hypothetical protein KI387_005566, partial [Taxus chinensis]
EFDFAVVANPKKSNLGPDSLSSINSRDDVQIIGETMSNAQLVKLNHMPTDLEDIGVFLGTGLALEGNNYLVIRYASY